MNFCQIKKKLGNDTDSIFALCAEEGTISLKLLRAFKPDFVLLKPYLTSNSYLEYLKTINTMNCQRDIVTGVPRK